MTKSVRGLLIIVMALGLAGCATREAQEPSDSRKLPPGARGQFACADRNANEYIDQTELIYLRQCGIGENLNCNGETYTGAERPPASDFDLGLRMLQVTDVDKDDRISKLEFRAHCSSAAESR